MDYLSIKALHIIFIVTWFAGLFYMFRLFVYYAEAHFKKVEPEAGILKNQYKIMMKRLWYIISWPSAILTLIFGFWLLYINPSYLSQGFMHLKLGFVFLLFVYQIYGEILLKRILRGDEPLKPMKYRFLNEVPTVLLIAIVFLIVLKNSIDWIWGTVAILGIAIGLSIAVQIYKKAREK